MINQDATIQSSAGSFLIEQRNAGFAVNDGKWIVQRLPELYWSHGTLYQRRAGEFVGTFDTRAAAVAATEN